MVGLDHATAGVVTQGMGIAAPNVTALEAAGWLQETDDRPLRYRRAKFDGAHFHSLSTDGHTVHPGVDTANDVGTPIRTVQRCKLLIAGTYDETGEHYVMLGIHKNTLGHWDTVWFGTHLRADSVSFAIGRVLPLGTVFAEMGRSGRLVTGPHLHEELRHSFAADPGPVKYSANWFRYNVRRFLSGHDMAATPWIVPNF
jgi:hypothetical protein